MPLDRAGTQFDPEVVDVFLKLHREGRFNKLMASGSQPAQLYCWGSVGSGKTHLLQACCRHADELARTAAYLPLQDSLELPPELLQGWEHYQLVCVDDIDAVAGHAAWEEALFHCFNRIREAGGRLLVSS